jgi:hypothetical protein
LLWKISQGLILGLILGTMQAVEEGTEIRCLECEGPVEGRVTDVPTRDKVTGSWRRLHDGKLYDLHSSVPVLFG